MSPWTIEVAVLREALFAEGAFQEASRRLREMLPPDHRLTADIAKFKFDELAHVSCPLAASGIA